MNIIIIYQHFINQCACSDVNAALYYGFLILHTGDFDGLFRRMLAVSYEDIGLVIHRFLKEP
ncbi:hypothetical protein ONA24_00725 [Mycoplasmopsis cynos]|nr:hypothetical protein [Mycoplasmopsis cynos]WAM09864.1 hypothetical protein ONA24_00725 [Mycoplasmopsis cynos]